ncbi:hypothetical protein TWF718_010473 [Orbilia javanica]|uniref:Uncharacterized protein n=1 Tax=Orbilia javanica TaxID=47235 RepID=A0AAN8MJQ1_9PEZI
MVLLRAILVLLGTRCLWTVDSAPVGDTKNEVTVSGSENQLYISQTGVQCRTPLEIQDEISLQNGLELPFEPPKQDIATNRDLILEDILRRLTERYCESGTGYPVEDRGAILQPHKLNHKYGCLCFKPKIQKDEVEFPSLRVQIDLDGNRPKLDTRLCGRRIDEEFPETRASKADSVCQWYLMYTGDTTPEAVEKDAGVSKTPISQLQNTSEAAEKPPEPSASSGTSSSKVKRNNISLPASSNTTAITPETPQPAPPTVLAADTFQNRTILNPSSEISNKSSVLESRVDRPRTPGSAPGGIETFFASTVRVKCEDPDTILEFFTPSYYKGAKELSNYPNWDVEVAGSSREDVISLIEKQIFDCSACHCETVQDDLGRQSLKMVQGTAGVLANITPENCGTAQQVEWCKNILGCYCQEDADVVRTAPISHVNTLPPPPRPPVDVSEYVGLTATNIINGAAAAPPLPPRRLGNDLLSAEPGDSDLPPYALFDPFPEEDTPDDPPPSYFPINALIPPAPGTIAIPDPQEPQNPVLLEGPGPGDEGVPVYSLNDPLVPQPLPLPPPDYTRRDPRAAGRRARFWNGVVAGAGFLIDRFPGGRGRNRFRGGGGSGHRNLEKRDIEVEYNGDRFKKDNGLNAPL